METIRIPNGAMEKITALFVDEGGDPITGETVPLSIWRESNGQWYTGAVWQAGYTTFSMSEKSNGYYYYDFDTTGLSDDVYHVRAICSNADCANPVVEGEIKVGDFIDNIDVAISSRSSHTAADIWSVITRELTDKSGFNLASDQSGVTIGTITSVTNDVGITQTGADKVWNTTVRTLTAFSTSLALSVWDVLETAIATMNSIGIKLKTNLDVVLSSRAQESGGNIIAIKNKTDSLNFTSTNVHAHIKVTDDIDLSVTQKASVNVEVDGALNTAFDDDISINATGLLGRIRKLMWILRNKMVVTDATGDTIIYKDNDTTEAINVATALTDDGTTTTRKRLD